MTSIKYQFDDAIYYRKQSMTVGALFLVKFFGTERIKKKKETHHYTRKIYIYKLSLEKLWALYICGPWRRGPP